MAPLEVKEMEIQPLNADSGHPTKKVKLYPERWWILVSVSILQFGNLGHWIAFGSVTKMTAIYYDQPGDKMDLIVLCSYIINIPACLFATALVNGIGLKNTLNLSATLSTVGESPVQMFSVLFVRPLLHPH